MRKHLNFSPLAGSGSADRGDRDDGGDGGDSCGPVFGSGIEMDLRAPRC